MIKIKNAREKIERLILNRTTKREIKQDLINFDREIVEAEITDSWSTKKLRKAISKGPYFLQFLTCKIGKRNSYDTSEIIKEATDFFP